MSKVMYTAEGTVTGLGRNGQGRSSDGAVDVSLRTPSELGGDGGGANPEQLFAIGYAACFGSAVEAVGRRKRQEIPDLTVDGRVRLINQGKAWTLGVDLDVTLPGIDDDLAVEIVSEAHQSCPYSNATRGNIDVTLTANGKAVE